MRDEPYCAFNIRMTRRVKRILDGYCIMTNQRQWVVTEAAIQRFIATERLKEKNSGSVGLAVLNEQDKLL